MATKEIVLKLAAQVTGVVNYRNKLTGWRAAIQAQDGRYAETTMYDTREEAVSALHDMATKALNRNEPILIYWQDLVGLGYYDSHFGWTYVIRQADDQRTEPHLGCTHSGYDTRFDVERSLRRHMAQMVGGVVGGELLTSWLTSWQFTSQFDVVSENAALVKNDVLDHYAMESWQAGCYFWRVSRDYDQADVMPNSPQGHLRNETMRRAGDQARERFSDLRRNGAEPAEAFITARGELEGRYGNGETIGPNLPILAKVGEPVPAGAVYLGDGRFQITV
jgi:hypothetical protein